MVKAIAPVNDRHRALWPQHANTEPQPSLQVRRPFHRCDGADRVRWRASATRRQVRGICHYVIETIGHKGRSKGARLCRHVGGQEFNAIIEPVAPSVSIGERQKINIHVDTGYPYPDNRWARQRAAAPVPTPTSRTVSPALAATEAAKMTGSMAARNPPRGCISRTPPSSNASSETVPSVSASGRAIANARLRPTQTRSPATEPDRTYEISGADQLYQLVFLTQPDETASGLDRSARRFLCSGLLAWTSRSRSD